jgi:uncharacterized protein YgiM (DUF1202 family)
MLPSLMTPAPLGHRSTFDPARRAVVPIVIGLLVALLAVGMTMYVHAVQEANQAAIYTVPALAPAPPLPPLPTGSSVIIAANVAEIRSSPSVAGSVIDKVQRWTELEVASQSGDWIEVRLPDQRTGWVAQDRVVTATSYPASP